MSTSNIPANEKRILGAIFPLQGAAYFLKITDTIERIEKIRSPFPEIVRQFQLAESSGQPEFTLPEGWVIKPGDDFAVAKVDIPVPGSDKPAVMTISKLVAPQSESQWPEYVLAQMNRWNGQVSQPEQSLESMMESLQAIPRDGSKIPAYLFDKNGANSPGSQSNPPAPTPRSGDPTASQPTGGAEPSAAPQLMSDSKDALSSEGSEPVSGADERSGFDASKLQLDAPPQWEKQPDRAFRLVTFRIPGLESEPDGELVVSQAEDIPLENTKMWSRQVLKSEDAALSDEIAKHAMDTTEKIPAGDREATLYSLRGGDEPDSPSLLIAVIPIDQTSVSLFVKLRGTLKLTEQQKSNLLRFVDTMRWE